MHLIAVLQWQLWGVFVSFSVNCNLRFHTQHLRLIQKVNSNKGKGRVWIFLYKFKRLAGLLVSFLLCFDFWRLERSYHVKVFNI